MKHILKSITSISSGLYLKPFPFGGIASLQVSDFGASGELVHTPKREFKLTQKQQRYLLRSGDVLLVSKGSSPRALLVPENCFPAVASSAFFVIRPMDKRVLLPAYLAWWFNSPKGQAILKDLSRGSAIASLSKKNIADIEVPVPPLAQQYLIAEIDILAKRRHLLETQLSNARLLSVSLGLLESIKH